MPAFLAVFRRPGETRYFDFIPHGGVSLGNIDTSLRMGGVIRLSWNLPEDFGVPTIDSLITTEGGQSRPDAGPKWSSYLFTGVEGKLVLYPAFLDGNLFSNSHHVAKEPLLAEWKTGLAFAVHRWELGYTFVHRTPEFTRQLREDRFGSLFFKYKF